MTSQHPVGRRSLFGGAAALAGGAVVAAGAPASADPSADPPAGPSATRPNGKAIASTIASPSVRGYSYRTLGEWDFSAEGDTSNRKFGTKGVYTAGTQSSLWGTVDSPAGARFREVEVYAFNNTGVTQYASVWLWTASDGYLSEQLASITVPSDNTLAAYKVAIAADRQGPYVPGTKIMVTLYTTTDAKLQINGARLGFSGGGQEIGLLLTAQRVFSGALTGGSTRTLTMPTSLVTKETAGVVLNVTATKGKKAGSLQIYAADRPAGPAVLRFPKKATAQAHTVLVPVSALGQVRVRATKSVKVTLDVIGTVG